jgi:mannose-6-phosphate isomerase-like protein (cupin superfamily)
MNQREERPWGWFETLGQGDSYLVKRLVIKAGHRFSLQTHQYRDETWIVVGGNGLITIDDQGYDATPGLTLFIPAGAVHRAEAENSDLEIVEVQRGVLLSEEDINRISDDYGRS